MIRPLNLNGAAAAAVAVSLVVLPTFMCVCAWLMDGFNFAVAAAPSAPEGKEGKGLFFSQLTVREGFGQR